MPMLFWMVLPFAMWDAMSPPTVAAAPAGSVDPLRPNLPASGVQSRARKLRTRGRVNASA